MELLTLQRALTYFDLGPKYISIDPVIIFTRDEWQLCVFRRVITDRWYSRIEPTIKIGGTYFDAS